MILKRPIYRSLALILLGYALVQTATADIIHLGNGDRITGEVQSLAKGILTIKTDYAGHLAITMEAVTHIESAAPLAILLSDENILEGVLTLREGAMGIETAEAWMPVSVTDIAAASRDAAELAALAAPEVSKLWGGTVDLGAALRSGNTDTTDVKFSVTATRSGERNTLKLGVSAAYGAADGTLNTRRYSGDFRWQYYLQERLYLYTLGMAERDDGRKLDLRLQGGGGLGYEFIKREKTTLAADLGLTYTYEKWVPLTPWEEDRIKGDIRGRAFNRLYDIITSRLFSGQAFSQDTGNALYGILADIRSPLRSYSRRTESYPNLRIGTQFSQVLFKTSKLTEDLTLLPNLEDLGEFRALSELAFTTPVTDSISLRTSLKSEYDSLARQKAIESWDHTLMTEIRYSF